MDRRPIRTSQHQCKHLMEAGNPTTRLVWGPRRICLNPAQAAAPVHIHLLVTLARCLSLTLGTGLGRCRCTVSCSFLSLITGPLSGGLPPPWPPPPPPPE